VSMGSNRKFSELLSNSGMRNTQKNALPFLSSPPPPNFELMSQGREDFLDAKSVSSLNSEGTIGGHKRQKMVS
jgi:hypothetical protein